MVFVANKKTMTCLGASAVNFVVRRHGSKTFQRPWRREQKSS